MSDNTNIAISYGGEQPSNTSALDVIYAARGGRQGGGAPLPTLTLSGALTFATDAAAGTLVANIGNVPASATPTITPNDGRLAIAGSAGAWKVVKGMTASSLGSLAFTVNAAGAQPASATADVTAPAGAVSTYLPTVSSTPYVWGGKRMVAAYNGPLYQITKFGGTTMDVSAKGASGTAANDLPDYAAITTFLAGDTSPTVTKIYDQSGAGKHMVMNGTACLFDLAQALAGCVPFVWGFGSRMDAPVAVNRNNFTVMDAAQPTSTADANQALWGLQAGGANIGGLYYGFGTLNSAQFHDGSNNTLTTPAPLALRSNPSAIGFTSSGTERRLYARETSGTYPGTSTSNVSDTFSLGFFNFGGGWYFKGQRWGTALYPTALSQADTVLVRNAMTTMFAIPTAFTSRLILVGDSIVSGLQARASKNLSYLFSVAKPQTEIFNLGISGQTMADAYANRGSNENQLFTGAYGAGKCLLLIASGTNDMGVSGQNDTQVYATLTNYVAAEKAVGHKVLVVPVLPRTDGGWDGTKEGYRVTYRTRVNGNVAGADGVVDIADPATTMGALTAPDNTNLYADKLHPNDSPNGGGYAALGPIYLANSVISAL